MTAKFPVVPIAVSTLAHAFIALAAFIARPARAVARVRRNRRDARILAGLDQHMLADLGITRADLSDAFSEPFWEDPTVLLRQRAEERRRHRPATAASTRELRRLQAEMPARANYWI